MAFLNTNRGYWYQYEHAAVTTDCVVFGYDGMRLKVLLIQRGIEPYKGSWAFPGGFMKMTETAEEGARRELKEETGFEAKYLEQFYTFTAVNRDPRERVITIAFLALVNIGEVHGGDDASRAEWFDIDDIPSLAFDHERILRVAQAKLREKIHFEPIGFDLLPETFKMSELQNLYEAILDVKFDRRNFYRKITSVDVLEQVDPEQERTSHRIPIIYRFNARRYKELKRKGFRLEF